MGANLWSEYLSLAPVETAVASADRSWAQCKGPEVVSGASELFDAYSLPVCFIVFLFLAPHATVRVVPVAISDLEAVPA